MALEHRPLFIRQLPVLRFSNQTLCLSMRYLNHENSRDIRMKSTAVKKGALPKTSYLYFNANPVHRPAPRPTRREQPFLPARQAHSAPISRSRLRKEPNCHLATRPPRAVPHLTGSSKITGAPPG